MIDTRQRRSPHLLRVVLILGAVVAALVVAAKMGIVGNGPSPNTAVRPSAPPAASATAVAAVPGTISEGVWIVGTDIQPGTYRSTGPKTGDYCMWSRHSSVSGGAIANIIESDGSYDGQMVVTVQAGDKLFRTRGCEPFTKVG